MDSREKVVALVHEDALNDAAMTTTTIEDYKARLGYDMALIHTDDEGRAQAPYVKRRCETCGAQWKFIPLVGEAREQHCKQCGRVTVWRVVP